MTWSASVTVHISSRRDSDMGTCPTTYTGSKSLCSSSVVGRCSRKCVCQIEITSWRVHQVVFLQAHHHALQTLWCIGQGFREDARKMFVVGNDVHLPAVGILVEFLNSTRPPAFLFQSGRIVFQCQLVLYWQMLVAGPLVVGLRLSLSRWHRSER